MSNFKSRAFFLLLYPDCADHSHAFELISRTYSYCGILHDKDTFEENIDPDDELYDSVQSDHLVLKKPHWHIVVRFGAPRWKNAFANELGIKPNFVRECGSVDSCLLYLLHRQHPDKYQYDETEVFGPLTRKLNALLIDQDDEGQRVLQVLDIIDSKSGIVSYRQILKESCECGLWSSFRKLGSGVKYLIDEHNLDFTYNSERR